MKRLTWITLLAFLVACNPPASDVSRSALQTARQAMGTMGEVLAVRVTPERTTIRLSTAAQSEATDRVVVALSELLAGKVKRLEFAFEHEQVPALPQAFPCAGATRITYPDPGPKPTRLAGSKVVLNPGHGLTQKDNGAWVYQRPIPPAKGAYLHEDPNNLEIAQVVGAVLATEGTTLFSTRNLNKNAGNGASGQSRWMEASRHHVQALGIPDHVWNSEGNPDSDCNTGRDIRVRPFYANQVQADVLVGLHSNAGVSSARGTWVLFNTAPWDYAVPGTTRVNSALLARALGNAVVAAIRQARPELSWPDPVFKDSLEYGEINFAKMPAVILEVGFHTNPTDSTAMQQDSFRQAVAKGIRDGLKTYLGDTGPPPAPNWVAPSSLSFTAGVVGGQTATASFTLSNTGTGGGTFGITSSDPVFSAQPSSEFLNSGAQKTIAVTAVACTSTTPQTGTLSIASPGANTAIVNLSRTCTAPALPIPAPLVVGMSSNGRMLLSWPNVAGAAAYGFSAWFDGVSIPVQGRALPKGGVYSSAVATFISNPAAPQKQGKQACFSVRSESSTQVSGFSPQACVEYRYYTNDIGIQGEGEPELRLGER